MTGNGWAILAMHGMPGVGKSAFATELWGRLHSQHPGEHAFVRWEPEWGEPTRAAVVRRLLVELKVPERELIGAGDDLCERQLRHNLQDKPGHLIVIDGLCRGIPQSELDDLLSRIKTTHSTFIVVSRTKPTGYGADQLFEVRPLGPASSKALVRSMLGKKTELDHPAEFAEVIQSCDGLPRALHTACTRVRKLTTLADVSEALKDPETCLPFLKTDDHDLGAELASEYNALSENHRRVLGAVSLLRSRAVGAQAVSTITGIGVRAAEELLAELEDVRLLSAETPGFASPEPRYVQHRLVGLALRELNADACQAFGLTRQPLDRYYETQIAEIFDEWSHEQGSSPGASEKLLALLRHDYRDALTATLDAYLSGRGKTCWQLGHMITGLFPIVSCDWRMWEEFFEAAQRAAKRDGEIEASVSTVQAQGLAYLLAGGLSDAEPLLRDSLRRATERQTYDADVQIRSYVHLAESEMERGLYTKAREHIESATPIRDPRPYDADQDWAGFVSAVVNRNLQEDTWYQVDLLEQARILLKGVRDPTRMSRMSLYIADAMREVGQGLGAEDEYHKTWESAESAGDAFMAARASYSTAMLLLDWKDVPGARRTSRELVQIIKPVYEASRDPLWRDRYAFLCARLKFEEGEHLKSQDCRNALIELYNRLRADQNDRWLYTNTVLLLAEAHRTSQRPDLARQLLETTMQGFEYNKNTQALARAHVILGHINTQAKDKRKARAEFKKAVDLFMSCGDDRGEYSARKELARSWRGPAVVRSGHQRFRVRRLDLRRSTRKLEPPTGRPLGVPVHATAESSAGRTIPAPRSADHIPWHERSGAHKFTVFMCHADADELLAKEVARAFDTHRIPTWTSWTIPVGASLTTSYEEGLRTSEYVVVCVTPRLRDTGWADATFAPHLHASLSDHLGPKVIPLLVGDGTAKDIPLLLANMKPVTFGTDGFEKLIAQLKERKQEG
ncbi:tetratricopeptide (TPR) repeat protein [Catenulispora sp. GAS73]|uniref:TIR domain-containing protein n=1 Tax=Catenulispora sp. GAS73 TaxID=3156269 RepID=UPI003515A265